jgi:hypothetical protein
MAGGTSEIGPAIRATVIELTADTPFSKATLPRLVISSNMNQSVACFLMAATF